MKNYLMNGLLMTVVFFVFGGCSSINELLYKDKCSSNNWQTIGEQEGLTGRADFAQWGSRCQAFGVKPDKAQYDKGYELGAQKYCYNRAYETGKKGGVKDLSATCSSKEQKNQYDLGFSTGLGEFCTSESGRNQALAGLNSNETCKSMAPYAAGYAAGLKELCTTQKAFRAGAESLPFDPKNCPSKELTSINAAYLRGKNLQQAKLKVAKIEAEINDLQKKLFDPATPADAKGHYQNILDSKKAELKVSEREVFKLEESRL